MVLRSSGGCVSLRLDTKKLALVCFSFFITRIVRYWPIWCRVLVMYRSLDYYHSDVLHFQVFLCFISDDLGPRGISRSWLVRLLRRVGCKSY